MVYRVPEIIRKVINVLTYRTVVSSSCVGIDLDKTTCKPVLIPQSKKDPISPKYALTIAIIPDGSETDDSW